MTGPVLLEAAAADITAGTIILTAPAGFEFNTEATVMAFVSGLGTPLTLSASGATPTASTITFTVSGESAASPSTIFFSNIQVRPTTCTAGTTGNLVFSGTSTAVGNAGVLTVVHGVGSKLTFDTQPSTPVVAGVAIATQPIVHLLDQNDNVITTDSASVITITSFSENTCTTARAGLTGTTTETVAAGIADFAGNNLASTLAGANLYLKASLAGVTSACSTVVTVNTAADNHLHFSVQPSSTAYSYVDFGTQPTVVVRDQYNNVTASTPDVTLLADTVNNTCAAATTTNFSGTRVKAAGTTFTNLQYDGIDTNGIWLCATAAGPLTGVSSQINVYGNAGQTTTSYGTTTATTVPQTTTTTAPATTTTTTPAPAVTSIPQPAKPIAEMNQAEKNTYTMQLQQFLIQLLTQLLTLLKK